MAEGRGLGEAGKKEGSSHIKVVVRLRPLQPAEKESGEAVRVHSSLRALSVHSATADGRERTFAFHACLPPHTSQKEMFGKCNLRYLLDCACRGFAATVMAYGQTGSGKTYTITGESSDANTGLVPRSLQYLFRQKESSPDLVIQLSNYEIYNEQVYDLLSSTPGEPLKVRWDARSGFHVDGLTIVNVEAEDDAHKLVALAAQRRQSGAHNMNEDSSRSHSILSMHCVKRQSASEHGEAVRGKATFVDLAGSERLKATGSKGGSQRESGNINRSLMCLGKVIAMLSEHPGATGRAHIPYRDSKLTKLLMDSLGGNNLTLMIACCSVSHSQLDETMSTLHYAQQAKNIVNIPTVMSKAAQSSDGTNEAHRLRQRVSRLQQENRLLKQQLTELGVQPAAEEGGFNDAGPPDSSTPQLGSQREQQQPHIDDSLKPQPLELNNAPSMPGSSNSNSKASTPYGDGANRVERLPALQQRHQPRAFDIGHGQGSSRAATSHAKSPKSRSYQQPSKRANERSPGGAKSARVEPYGAAATKEYLKHQQQQDAEQEELRSELDRLKRERATLELHNRDLHTQNEELQRKLERLESAFIGIE